MGKGSRTTSGVMWSAIERFSVQGVQFVLSFIIAKQLLPQDYGLVAMLSVFMAIAQTFIDSGFTSALIQKQNRSQSDFSTVFYFSVTVSCICYLLLRWAAPLIAGFYNGPLLEEIIIWFGLNLIISSFATVQRAILIIDINFRKQALVSLFSVLLSGAVAVYMAYGGYGVWSLVVQTLLNNTLNTVILWISVKWVPSPEFSMLSFRTLFSYGSKLLAGGLIHTVFTNLYTAIIGKVYNTLQLGLYNRAQTTSNYLSHNISSLVNRVLFPVFCKEKDDDKLVEKFYTSIKLTSYLIFPLMIGLATVAEPFIQVVLTDKWIDCVPYMQVLCIAYMWDPLMNFSVVLINSKGRSEFTFKAEIIKKITAIAILAATIPAGVMAMCCGLLIYSFADIFIITRFTRIVLPEVNLKNHFKEIMPVAIQSVIMGIIVFCIMGLFDSAICKLIYGIISGVIGYIILSFFICRNEMSYLYELICRKGLK